MSTLGNINSCLNPKLIYNKYTDTKMYVPCRKCFRCRDTYGSEWSRRCENECKQHRYSLFVTLTYDNDHIPLFEPMIDDDGNLMSAWCSNRGFENGKFISSDIARSCPPKGMEDTICFAYPCKKDIQDFLKRLRSCIDYNLNRPKIELLTDKSKFINENRLRYFICSEYGPRTFRPHYHAIFWYDSEELQRHITRFIRETWQNGNSVIELVNNSASRYVAKYVNGDTRLPSFLRTEYTSTFHLASKQPYIGYCKDDEEALYDNVFNGSYGQNRINKDTGTLEFVPTSRSLENRLLPKCKGYRTISHFERVRIYSLAYDYKQQGLDYIALLPFSFDYAAYPHVDIHASLACLSFCEKFHTTPEIYVNLLEDYYYHKEMYLLRTQYEYQEIYINNLHMPLHHLCDFDLQLFSYLPRDLKSFNRSPWKDTMLTYGLNSFMLYDSDGYLRDEIISQVYGQRHSEFYRINIDRYTKIHEDSLKNKNLNEQMNDHLFM